MQQAPQDPEDEEHRHKVRLLGCTTALLLLIILTGVATCVLALIFGKAEQEAWRVLPPTDPRVSAAGFMDPNEVRSKPGSGVGDHSSRPAVADGL